MICQPHNFSRSSSLQHQKDYRQAPDERSSIVVALAGEISAEQALPHAVQLARRWNTGLRLVQVVNPIQPWDGSELGLMVNADVSPIYDGSEEYLEGIAEAINAANGVPVTAHTVTHLSVEDALRKICAEGAALLVIAKGRRSGLSQFLFGSITNHLVGRLQTPLLVVPAKPDGDSPGTVDYRRILVGVGSRDECQSVLSAAAAFALDDGECHLLRVQSPRAAYLTVRGQPGRPLLLRDEAWLHVLQAKEWLQGHGAQVGSHLVDHSYSPAQAILARAESLSADLTVVGTRYRLLPWWLRSGVAEYVVRHATTPVLLVPSHSTLPLIQPTDHVDVHSN